MITLEEGVDIVALHRSGVSIKVIARTLGISRNAVRRALRRSGPQQRAPRTCGGKLEPYKNHLLARVAEFPQLTLTMLCEEVHAPGHAGGLSILKEFTHPNRQRRRQPVVRFKTLT